MYDSEMHDSEFFFEVLRRSQILRNVRRKLKLTIKDISKEIGKCPASISYYEIGERLIPDDTFKKILDLAERKGLKLCSDCNNFKSFKVTRTVNKKHVEEKIKHYISFLCDHDPIATGIIQKMNETKKLHKHNEFQSNQIA